jgi:hypothetical protein
MRLQSREHHRQAFTMLGILALLIGALLWVLSIMSIISGPWSAILGAIFTAMSAVFGLLQWQAQSSPELVSRPSDPLEQQALYTHLTGISLGINKRRGALMIKVKKKYLGATLHLCQGFCGAPFAPVMVSNIVERKIAGSSMFIGVFHKLEPGNYTIYFHDPTKGTPVTIHAGQLSEIDWRYKDLENERP